MTTSNHMDQIHALNLAFSEKEEQLKEKIDLLTQREQNLTAELESIQINVASEKSALLKSQSEQEGSLQSRHAHLEKAFEEQLQAAQQEIQKLQQARTQMDQESAEHKNQARQALEDATHNFAQREQELTEQLKAFDYKNDEENSELIKRQAVEESARHNQRVESEKALNQQILHARQELERLKEELGSREKTHVESVKNSHQELEKLFRLQVLREQEISAQLLTHQQQAAREREELARAHDGRLRLQQDSQAEREKSFDLQIKSGQVEIQRLQQEQAQREKDHVQRVLQIQDKLEDQFRYQVKREQQFSAQLIILEKEKIQQAQKYSEQTSTLRTRNAERENLLNQKILKKQDELREQHQKWLERERALSAQLFALKKETEEKTAEQIRNHRKKEHDLNNEHAAREAGLKQQLNILHTELQTLQAGRAAREHEINAQLVDVHRQASLEKENLRCDLQEQGNALHFQRVEQEKVFEQQRQAANDEILRLECELEKRKHEYHERADRSKQALDSIIVQQAQLEQKINEQLLEMQEQAQQATEKYTSLLEKCTSIEAQLQAEIQSGQQTTMHLRQLLAGVQHSLDSTHASLAWRMTAPLRKLFGIFYSNKKQISTSIRQAEITEDASKTQLAIDHQTSTASTNTAIEPHTPASTQKSFKNMQNTAPTLAKLLALDGHHFVESAYKSLLKREPDLEGKNYYLSRLEAGYSKMQIICQLRFSKEGQKHNPNLSGLDSAIKKQRRSQNPLVGWIFSAIDKTENNNSNSRKLRAIEYKISNLANENKFNLDQLNKKLTGIFEFIQEQSASIKLENEKTAQTTSALITSLEKINSLICRSQAEASKPTHNSNLEIDAKNNSKTPDQSKNSGYSENFGAGNDFSPLTVEDLIQLSASNESILSIGKVSTKAKPLTIENLLEISKSIT